MQSRLGTPYARVFCELIHSHASCAKARDWQCNNWCAFWPAKGRRYRPGGLMIVGRALNRWKDTTFTTAQAQKDVQGILAKCQNSFAPAEGCPMFWVEEQWGDERIYNTRRSALWRMAKQLVAWRDGHEGKGWSEHLCWNNLMRVSPGCGGNPPEWSCEAQRGHAVNLFEREVRAFKPGTIVFFTGNDWFNRYAQDTGWLASMKPAKNRTYVYACGSILGSPAVVMPHPMGKSEDGMMEELREVLPRR